jgi:hypothetical protein
MGIKSKIYAVLFSSLFAFTGNVHAAPFLGIGPSLKARDSLIQDFIAGRAHIAAESVLDRVVVESLDALAREGSPEVAAEYREIWEREFARNLASRFTKIGDHEPLSRYLAKLLPILSGTLGKNSKYADLLSDLITLNYAIPVVFAPRGDWKRSRNENANRKEYQKHFVPFSGVLTYYTTLGTCRAVAKKYGLDALGRRLCPKIAVRLETEMSAHLAPKISDYVYDRANGAATLLRLSASDFTYTDIASLDAAIR